MSSLYRDRWIECATDEMLVRGYYFPWGTKHIPYGSIRSVRRVPIGPLTGKARIWGSTTLRYWASLDPGRPSKSTAFVLDIGQRIRPFITPDEPDAIEAIIRTHSGAEIVTGGRVIP